MAYDLSQSTLAAADKVYAMGCFDAAIALYKQVLHQNSAPAEVHKRLALCYESVGRTRDAIRHFNTYLKLNPVDADAPDPAYGAYRPQRRLFATMLGR